MSGLTSSAPKRFSSPIFTSKAVVTPVILSSPANTAIGFSARSASAGPHISTKAADSNNRNRLISVSSPLLRRRLGFLRLLCLPVTALTLPALEHCFADQGPNVDGPLCVGDLTAIGEHGFGAARLEGDESCSEQPF